jgi:hypothetical protein
MKKPIAVVAVLGAVSGTLCAFDPMSYPPPAQGDNTLRRGIDIFFDVDHTFHREKHVVSRSYV